jgi:hypothetical protein
MDETTLLIIVSLVGPVLGGIVGAIVGYYLGKRSLKAQITAFTERTETTFRQNAQAETHRQNLETAGALLKEIDRIRRLLDSGYHQFITSNNYWNPIPTIPTPSYSQLFSQGRVVKLGTQLAPLVDAAYVEIDRMNRGIQTVNHKVSENRKLAYNDTQRYLGDDWYPVVNAKDAFLRQAPAVEEGLRNIKTAPDT